MNQTPKPLLGRQRLHLPEVDSTNAWLHRFTTKSTPPQGFVVWADNQTAGIGQFGSTWHSNPGENLLFSLLLHPHFLPPEKQFLLAQCIALGLWDYLKPHVPDLRIKWPNDLMAGPGKLAGILIQNTLQGDTIRQAIVGIGLNVHQTSFPPYLPDATSLASHTQHSWNRYHLLTGLLAAMDIRYRQLQDGHHQTLRDDYILALYHRNEPRRYQPAHGPAFTGMIRGVDEIGRLLVEQTDNGAIRSFQLKEISYL